MAFSTKSLKIGGRRLSRNAVVLGVAAVVLAGGGAAWLLRPKGPAEPYRTAAVSRGDVTRSVSASGTLQALVTVEVGSQISGQIREILVDFNDEVKKGQVLAVIDPDTYTARVRQAEADLSASNATLAQQNASLAQAQAQVEVDRATYERTKHLADLGIASKQALDTAEAQYKRSQAGIEVARAQIGAQRARVAQSQAALQNNRVDLGRTTIVSPIDGVVVNRAIEPGQTVAASLQAPVLFSIAQDLSKVEVKINVLESDIGQVAEGQAVRFTVDAFPDDTFAGRVTQVRKQPETAQNVVAYTVIAQADNPGGRLLPGMTANADIVLEQRPNVLRAPAAALRFAPPGEQAAGARRTAQTAGPPGFGGGPAGAGQGGQGGQGGQRGGFGPQRILEQLNLNADQKTKAQTIFDEMRAASQGGDRAARQKATEDAFAKVEALLNPQQKTQFEVLRARMGGGRQGRGPDAMQRGVVYVLENGKPKAVPVQVGATDGSFTEIVGSLNPGDEVIVGGGPRAAATQGARGAQGAFGAPGGGALRRF